MSVKNIQKIGSLTGISIVVANMVGTGAFTSLGFQLEALSNTNTILSLWILGGVVALCGAFSYAEIGTDIKKSGGEYTFLSQIYHPVIGYLSGWISLTVGFAAPIALATMAFTEYLPIKTGYPKLIGICLVVLITLVHSRSLNISSVFQNISTFLKVFFILVFIAIGVILPADDTATAINYDKSYLLEIGSAAFAINLIYVSYSYSGWNAAAYITEEFRNPRKSLPRALIGGTLIVTVIYTLLQYTMLKHAAFSDLAGKLNVGSICVEQMLGSFPAKIFSGIISLFLVSGISAMVWIGARVTSSIAKDHSLWHVFKSKEGAVPVKALYLQCGISIFLILTGSFSQVMMYCGMLLNISTLMVVLGVVLRRYRNKRNNIPVKDNFKSPLFPCMQIFFIIVSLSMILFVVGNDFKASMVGVTNLVLGLITYFISRKKDKRAKV